MAAFLITVSLLAVFLILDRIHKILERKRLLEKEQNSARLEVLKIVLKDELYRFRGADNIDRWVSRLLEMLGYDNIRAAAYEEDNAYDYTCTKGEQTVYVACKLWDVKQFEAPVTRTFAQRLVGAMVGARIKKALIITAGALTDEAKQYLDALPVRYRVEVLDGEKLMDRLQELRKIQLQPLPGT